MTYMSSSGEILRVYAQCGDCGWQVEDRKSGEFRAKQHANLNGHRVVGGRMVSFEYDGRKKA